MFHWSGADLIIGVGKVPSYAARDIANQGESDPIAVNPPLACTEPAAKAVVGD